ncbi:MAG: indolepyruvate oxidoreductase subunit beta [Deltaproteobacteria bacterium]|jgi:indolepyruvate ferredoxin oxidoreductase beta subunit|nr:indolepyruvate oxidoreductase subunit beta [Deltaproteobacteria bacterium]
MNRMNLPFDPYNVIITGVGGQGNVMASRIVGNMLSRKGLSVTIGETFGASQRGGSVMSHLRISTGSSWSPQIPNGKCHLIISLEPTEAMRVLATYGNPNVKVLCNTRPIHAIGVISGDQQYPDLDEITAWVAELSEAFWFLDATEKAMELGNPILGNIMMIGAAAGIGVLPLDRKDFEAALAENLSADKLELNLKAYDLGVGMVQ